MPTNFPELVNVFFQLIKQVIPVLIAVAFLVFFFGIVKFIGKAGDETAIKEGRQQMVWGVIALFILVSIWGILRFAYGEFGFASDDFFRFLPVN